MFRFIVIAVLLIGTLKAEGNKCYFINHKSKNDSLDPPATWKEHCFEHVQNLSRVYFNSEVAIYFDKDVSRSITWPNSFFTKAWQYVKKVYGSFGNEGRLYVIFHTNKYGGGHPHTYFDQAGDYRNVIDCGPYSWTSGTGDELNMPVHEIAHIVELASKSISGSPAFPVWGDSKWAEIFIYDVYKGLGMTNEAQQWYNSMIKGNDNFPRAGTQWFKNWFYPIYTMNGPTMGSWTLNRYFELVAKYFPKNGKRYARDMNMGEFVNFWSGAVGYNLKDLATKAFGWNDEYQKQFEQGWKDYPDLPYGQVFRFHEGRNLQGTVNYQNLIGRKL